MRGSYHLLTCRSLSAAMSALFKAAKAVRHSGLVEAIIQSGPGRNPTFGPEEMSKHKSDFQGFQIFDSHQHFFDARLLRYPVFKNRSAGFEALVGDYCSLPRVYLPQDYALDTAGLTVAKTVWQNSSPTTRSVRSSGRRSWCTGLGAPMA
jgi:hypothetical protein